jgi:hypothetical protein
MRTTLTLDDQLEQRLKEMARESGRSFKDVVNDVLRRGLSVGDPPGEATEPFVVRPTGSGFRPGIDPLRLNQLSDEMETENFAAEARPRS